MEGYITESRKMDALYEAMRLVLEEFEDTKDANVAAAGHVIAELFVRRIKAMDSELDGAPSQRAEAR